MHFPAHLLGYPLSGTDEVSGDVILGGQYGNTMHVPVEGHPNMQMGHTVVEATYCYLGAPSCGSNLLLRGGHLEVASYIY
jgi:hypothetical protein